jgi:hypothetical protein
VRCQALQPRRYVSGPTLAITPRLDRHARRFESCRQARSRRRLGEGPRAVATHDVYEACRESEWSGGQVRRAWKLWWRLGVEWGLGSSVNTRSAQPMGAVGSAKARSDPEAGDGLGGGPAARSIEPAGAMTSCQTPTRLPRTGARCPRARGAVLRATIEIRRKQTGTMSTSWREQLDPSPARRRRRSAC